MLVLTWLAYDWNTHSQGKRWEEWWYPSVPRMEPQGEGNGGRVREAEGERVGRGKKEKGKRNEIGGWRAGKIERSK